MIEHNVKPGIQLCNMQDGSSGVGAAIMDFVTWFTNNDFGHRYNSKMIFASFFSSQGNKISLVCMCVYISDARFRLSMCDSDSNQLSIDSAPITIPTQNP